MSIPYDVSLKLSEFSCNFQAHTSPYIFLLLKVLGESKLHEDLLRLHQLIEKYTK